MKKIIYIFLALVLVTAAGLTGCGKAAKKDGLSIVATIAPEYDWVMNILGDNPAKADVTLLLDKGVDLHSFQPTADDIMKVANCDLFIYVGGESDEWVEDALKESVNKDMVVINLLETLGDRVKEEEVVEGMQEEEHDHDHGDDDHDDDHDEDDHDHDEETEYDEHVWLSLKNASILVDSISEALCGLDKANADHYRKQTEKYVKSLDALDKEYKDAVENAAKKTVLFGDRFPFRYLTDDYGLTYYAAFVGCSAETEASFETIAFLSKKVDELGLNAVMTIEGKDHRIAETIVNNTASHGQKILTLDSMQSTTSKDIAKGTDYLSIMRNNLEVLKEALK
jgi:zinc transport system substrate-binding protein